MISWKYNELLGVIIVSIMSYFPVFEILIF